MGYSYNQQQERQNYLHFLKRAKRELIEQTDRSTSNGDRNGFCLPAGQRVYIKCDIDPFKSDKAKLIDACSVIKQIFSFFDPHSEGFQDKAR